MNSKSEDFDRLLVRALIGQVSAAVPPGRSEIDVTTLVTRPMWAAWCRGVGLPENCEPTEWLGMHNTRRIYGSRTIVVESAAMASVSFPTGYPS